MKFRLSAVGAAAYLAVAAGAGAAVAQDDPDAALDAQIEATQSDAGALTFARQQAGSGDLAGAAATLERSLVARSGPGSDEVRLDHSAVLCELGDRQGGARQIGMVSRPDAAGWAEARQACGATVAAEARSPRAFVGLISVGVSYESDAFGALVSQIETPGFPAFSQEGAAILGLAAVETRFANSADGHAYAGGSLQTRHDISGPDTDYQLGVVRLGYARILNNGLYRLSGGGVVRHARLFGDGLLTEYGGQAELVMANGANSRWVVSGEAVSQQYEGFASPRDGGRYEVGMSYRSMPTPDRFWAAGVVLEYKEADTPQLGYSGWRIFVTGQMPLSETGAYFAASGVLRAVDFRDAPLITDRQETRIYLRAAVGAPLGREGLFIEGALTHSTRSYNDASSLGDYDSTGAELRLVYRFGQ